MSIQLNTQNLIIEKSKTKKNGCYRFRGVAYRVKEGRVTHLGNSGKIFECFCGFNVLVGTYQWSMYSDEAAQKILRGI